jgi:hypothetical protein
MNKFCYKTDINAIVVMGVINGYNDNCGCGIVWRSLEQTQQQHETVPKTYK